ncbi:MAG: glycoside hydrolase family 32 protein [Thermomicrobiales bacterium]|nr:glycoside hydrolase family 32 protein [Thermomicrobiales bacterium]
MTDPHRPIYHLMPERNWMNDPNGLIQWNGVYHAFYQHNPYGALWGNMSWGHARSTDLIHWEHLPLAIVQDPDGADANGCFSGAMVVHEGVPTMVYTGVRGPEERCCIAWPTDDELIGWRKHPGNPVVPETPVGVPTTIFRDHTLWREGDTWYMGVGSGIEGQGGAVLLYRSTDLLAWEYLHPLAIEQPELNASGQLDSTGWECPDFCFVDDEPILIACDWNGDPLDVSWWRGSVADHRFHAACKGRVDYGDCLYAPQTFRSEDGRRLFFGWMREMRSDADQVAAGWSGVMSLPREMRGLEDGTVAFRPAAEVDGLRGAHHQNETGSDDISTSAACEVVFSTPNTFSVSWDSGCALQWDGHSLTLHARDEQFSAALREHIAEIRVFIDHSLVEVYANDRVCMSTRIYADASSWDTMKLESTAPINVDVWTIASIW